MKDADQLRSVVLDRRKWRRLSPNVREATEMTTGQITRLDSGPLHAGTHGKDARGVNRMTPLPRNLHYSMRVKRRRWWECKIQRPRKDLTSGDPMRPGNLELGNCLEKRLTRFVQSRPDLQHSVVSSIRSRLPAHDNLVTTTTTPVKTTAMFN
ncbi:hypothetical protein ElyMa_003041500 [Elysia marginata]|uniref:Uncharacterized protein n=1 Tax=Elysia marginata TaxID=1093978 RepID=A0AAV4ILH4_9GAST|nr:hypothetical protein ElyMa_003041500 [Elysia marginata]